MSGVCFCSGVSVVPVGGPYRREGVYTCKNMVKALKATARTSSSGSIRHGPSAGTTRVASSSPSKYSYTCEVFESH